MHDFTAPSRFAEKYEHLRKNYEELVRMNSELVTALERQHDEIATLVARNDEVLRRCDDFFAAEQVNANGNGNHHRS